MEDTCTPSKKLIHPNFGYNYIEYSVNVDFGRLIQDQAEGLSLEEYSPKVNYFLTTALFKITSAFVIHPIDVTIVNVAGNNSTTTMLVRHLIDSYNRTDAINVLTEAITNGTLTSMLASMDNEFAYVRSF